MCRTSLGGDGDSEGVAEVVLAGGALHGWLRAWPFMAEAALPIQSFKTFYITSYFCGSGYVVGHKVVRSCANYLMKGMTPLKDNKQPGAL